MPLIPRQITVPTSSAPVAVRTSAPASAPVPSTAPVPAAVPAPWRLWVAKGATKDIVILDAVPGPIIAEHNWRNPETGRWDIYDICIGRGCPLCERAETYGKTKSSMVLTCINVSATSRDPRRLVELRSKQIEDLLGKAREVHGNTRGVRLRLVRAEDDRGSLGTGMYQGRDPGTLPAAYNYASLFPPTTAAELHARHGIPEPGDKSDGNVTYVNDDNLAMPW